MVGCFANIRWNSHNRVFPFWIWRRYIQKWEIPKTKVVYYICIIPICSIADLQFRRRSLCVLCMMIVITTYKPYLMLFAILALVSILSNYPLAPQFCPLPCNRSWELFSSVSPRPHRFLQQYESMFQTPGYNKFTFKNIKYPWVYSCLCALRNQQFPGVLLYPSLQKRTIIRSRLSKSLLFLTLVRLVCASGSLVTKLKEYMEFPYPRSLWAVWPGLDFWGAL